MQLFYLTRYSSNFSEDKSKTLTVPPGRHTVTLSLPANRFWGPLRFDPSKAPGTVRLHHIKVISTEEAGAP